MVGFKAISRRAGKLPGKCEDAFSRGPTLPAAANDYLGSALKTSGNGLRASSAARLTFGVYLDMRPPKDTDTLIAR